MIDCENDLHAAFPRVRFAKYAGVRRACAGGAHLPKLGNEYPGEVGFAGSRRAWLIGNCFCNLRSVGLEFEAGSGDVHE